MTLLLLLLVVVAVVAIVGSMTGPTWYRSRPNRRIVNDVVYEDVVRPRDEIVEEEIIEEEPLARGRARRSGPAGRRRIVEY